MMRRHHLLPQPEEAGRVPVESGGIAHDDGPQNPLRIVRVPFAGSRDRLSGDGAEHDVVPPYCARGPKRKDLPLHDAESDREVGAVTRAVPN
jgi:hypothetical protein